MKLNNVDLDKHKAHFNAYNQQGLSLIELLVAIAIIAVVFLIIAMGEVSSFTTLDKSIELRDAKTFAYRTLEDKYQEFIFDVVNANSIDASKSKFDEYLACQEGVSGCSGSDSYENYTVNWQLISEKALNSSNSVDKEGLVLLEVQVDWKEKDKQYSFSLADYLSCVQILNSDGSTVCPTPAIPEGHE